MGGLSLIVSSSPSSSDAAAGLGSAPGGRGAPPRGYWETLPVSIAQGSEKALPISGVLSFAFVTDVVTLAEVISAGAALVINVYHRDECAPSIRCTALHSLYRTTTIISNP